MAGNMDDLMLVPVDCSNVDQYIALIEALADYEHLEPPDEGAKARLARDVTSESPLFWARIAYLDGKPVGYLTYYFTYSTFLAKPTLFLEDIFVLEQYRHRGIGKALFAYCVEEAKKKGCGRMEWSALDWNAPAHKFYEGLGGKKMPWFLFRLLAEDFDKVR
jgi:GNAT superfamily N-acetyltransferase